MSAKRAHKVLAIEINPTNSSVQTDPVGKNPHLGLTWASLTAAQQAKLDGRAKNMCGQS